MRTQAALVPFEAQELEHPAFVYAGHTIWGLTHRILTGFLEVLD